MTAYVISDISVINAERYTNYREAVRLALEHHGGRYLVRGGTVHLLEGIWNPDRVVVIEFDSVEDARDFISSPEFQEARLLRQNAAMVNTILVDGVSPE
jgi:uncharacterized protein (DUF1330 family)